MNKIMKIVCILTLCAGITAYGAGSKVNGSVCYTPCDCCYDCNKCCVGQCDGYPFFSIRSQGRDAARELVGWQEFINKACMEERYSALSISVEYSRSFRKERIAHALFGSDLIGGCELLIQGENPCNKVVTVGQNPKHPKAWFADYFGLPGEYSSKVKFCPCIQNAIIDLNFYWGLDNWAKGTYVRINAPIVWTKWELCMSEQVVCTGSTDTYPAGYMAQDSVARSSMAKSFSQYMAGGVIFGDMKTPMQFGLISNCDLTKTRLAEIDIAFGKNFYLEDDYHFGAFLYIAAPAGNRPCAKYLFEPIVGNGKHWELGGGLSGSWIFYRDCDCEDRYLGVWFEATLAHLVRACQTRSFDFCGKPNSRYMLLAEMGTNTDEIKLGGSDGDATEAVTAHYQYAKNLIPAINWSTLNVDVKIPVQADIAIKLGWVRDNWSVDFGYNLWARAGEKFCDCCPDSSAKLYAIKGDSYLYGEVVANTPYPLPISQSKADIHQGKNWPAQIGDVSTDIAIRNVRIDNPQLAWTSADAEIVSFSNANYQMFGSYDPVFVNKGMLNMGKAPSAISHSLFLHASYAWKHGECRDWTPFLGVGGKVEFAQDNWKDCCDNCCSKCGCTPCCCNACCIGYTTCTNCDSTCDSTCCDTGCDACNDCCNSRKIGLSQWGLWVKGGFSFD